MKQRIFIFLITATVLIGAAKLVLVVAANQVMAQMKDDLVQHGLLQYGTISTSLSEGMIEISDLSFKSFKYKQDLKSELLHLKFDGVVDLYRALFTTFARDYSALTHVEFQGLSAQWPSIETKSLIDEGLNPSLNARLGLLSCNGTAIPTQEKLALLGAPTFSGALILNMGDDVSTLELASPELGRFIFELNLTAYLHGEQPLALARMSYAENGYYRRLNQVCAPESDRDLSGLAAAITAGWKESMHNEGWRINEPAVAQFRSFITNGGLLELVFEDGVMRNDQYDWQVAARAQFRLNNEPTALVAESYLQAPVVEQAPSPVVKPEPEYLTVEVAMLDTLEGRQLRATLLSGKQVVGNLTSVDEHLFVLTPIDGDGSVSYTLKRVELDTLEAWSD